MSRVGEDYCDFAGLINRSKRRALKLLLAFLIVSSACAQESPAFVKLTAKHNEEARPVPDVIVLGFEGYSRKLSVKDGRFEVPPDLLRVKGEVTFLAHLDGEQIQTGVYSSKFTEDSWTLVLEDKRFSHEFQPIPRGAKVRSSYIIVFESETAEGTVLFDPHCRSKAKVKEEDDSQRTNAKLSAQSTTPWESQCFSIHVRLNGKPIEGPQTITLKTKQSEDTVSLDGGCFTAPAALFAEKEVDVAVVFHGGEPENALTETGCHTPLQSKGTDHNCEENGDA